jgi:hypothetical protein
MGTVGVGAKAREGQVEGQSITYYRPDGRKRSKAAMARAMVREGVRKR